MGAGCLDFLFSVSDKEMIRKIIRPILVMGICVSMSSWPPVRAESAAHREYLIKAAFLYNFAKFIDWPAEAFPNDRTPLTLCIFGEDPFGVALESIKGKTVKGRKLVIQHSTRVEDLEQCHILFVSASEEKRLRPILSGLRGKTILTVSDMNGFARRGGIINLVTEKSKIRFEVNVEVTELAGLKISSKLLKLAKIVREGRPEGDH